MTPLQLPTKDQIAALTDLEAISDLKEAVQRSIDHIEAQLEFGPGDDAWAKTATNALALHRYVNRLLARRLYELRDPAAPIVRPRDANRLDTNVALKERPTFDPSVVQYEDIHEVDDALARLAAILEAVELDRADEIANGPGRRDEGFLAITGGVLKRLRGERNALSACRAGFVKKLRRAEHDAAQAGRQETFIEAARLVLDRDTYKRVWEVAERLTAAKAAA